MRRARMPRLGPSILSRWARWGLLSVTLAMATALVVTAWISRERLDQASEVLEIGQRAALLRRLYDPLLADTPITNERLQKFFVDNKEELGLRFVEIRSNGTTRLETLRAGSPAAPLPDPLPEPPSKRGPWQTVRIGDRIRVFARTPPPAPPEGAQAGAALPPPPHKRESDLIVEFEPVVGNDLRQDAARAFALSATAAGAFLVIAMLLWRLLRQRERTEARDEQERRLTALGEMSAVLAHEIRNPLASLKGNAQLLLGQLEPETVQHRKAERVVKEAERIQTLTSALLEFVRSGSIESERINPVELLTRSAESVGAEIVLDVSEAPTTWPLDRVRMQQVFSNLLDNAQQATRHGEPIDIRVFTEQDELKVSVRDHGEGIPKGQEERIFEPFHTTRTQGVGLGLAVAQRIVELHGGKIGAANHPEGGAVFMISIPKEA
jgi:two-component system sensor histidine kinase HydH